MKPIMTGADIKRLRLSLRLSQGQFAKKLGVQRSTVSRWERGAFQPLPLYLKAIKELR